MFIKTETTSDIETDIIQHIKDGETYRDISAKTGISIATISRTYRKHTGKRKRRPDLPKDRIHELAEQGHSLQQIADKIGYSVNSVKSVCSRMSLSLRERNLERDDIIENLFAKK